MEVNVSGFKKTGSWGDVVIHGEKLELALRTVDTETDYSIETELIDEFQDWRPKLVEAGDKSPISERTSKKASINKGAGEKKDKKPSEDLGKAASEVGASINSLSNRDVESMKQAWKDSTRYFTRATDTKTRQMVRTVEQFVYENMMTKVSPYYFDNELISANIKTKTEAVYTFEININDDILKQHLTEVLENLDEKERWHPELDGVGLDEDRSVEDTEVHSTEMHTPSIEDESTQEEIKEDIEQSNQTDINIDPDNNA
jgi:hypothetical protein